MLQVEYEPVQMCSSVNRSKSKMFTFQTRVHFNYHMYNRLDSHNCLLIYMKINYVYILQNYVFSDLERPFALSCPHTKHRMLYITAFYAVKVCNNLLALTVRSFFLYRNSLFRFNPPISIVYLPWTIILSAFFQGILSHMSRIDMYFRYPSLSFFLLDYNCNRYLPYLFVPYLL